MITPNPKGNNRNKNIVMNESIPMKSNKKAMLFNESQMSNREKLDRSLSKYNKQNNYNDDSDSSGSDVTELDLPTVS